MVPYIFCWSEIQDCHHRRTNFT